MDVSSPRQAPLELEPKSLARLDDFMPGARNRELFALLRRIAAREEMHSVHIYGARGEGRSHLLQGVCRSLVEAGETAYYLGLGALPTEDLAAILQGLEEGRVLCLDDLECLAGQDAAERALFHCLNRRRARRGLLLSSATLPPGELGFGLPDLGSRLDASLSYRLYPLEEKLQRQLLCSRAAEHGMELPSATLRFILSRARRDTGALLQVLEQLQYRSLAEQRRITVPFVKEVCGW